MSDVSHSDIFRVLSSAFALAFALFVYFRGRRMQVELMRRARENRHELRHSVRQLQFAADGRLLAAGRESTADSCPRCRWFARPGAVWCAKCGHHITEAKP